MLGILGGTGPEGKGLALRLAMAGEVLIIGSRDKDRAEQVASEIRALVPDASITGETNVVASTLANVAFVAVPYQAQRALLGEIAEHLVGKTVVSTVVPMGFSGGKAVPIQVLEGSAAMEAQTLLPKSFVVSALQNTSAAELAAHDKVVEGDVIACSQHQDSKVLVMDIVARIKNLRAVDGGGLANARYVEDFTSLLVNINRIYKTHAGVKITGI